MHKKNTPRVHRSEIEILAPEGVASDLSEVLRKMRQVRGLSQVAAGRLIGVSPKRIARIEQRPGNFRFDLFVCYVAALGCRLYVSKRAALRRSATGTSKSSPT